MSELKKGPYTEEEDELLKRIFPDMRSSEVAKAMNRKESSIADRARRLQLVKSKAYKSAMGFELADKLVAARMAKKEKERARRLELAATQRVGWDGKPVEGWVVRVWGNRLRDDEELAA